MRGTAHAFADAPLGPHVPERHHEGFARSAGYFAILFDPLWWSHNGTQRDAQVAS